MEKILKEDYIGRYVLRKEDKLRGLSELDVLLKYPVISHILWVYDIFFGDYIAIVYDTNKKIISIKNYRHNTVRNYCTLYEHVCLNYRRKNKEDEFYNLTEEEFLQLGEELNNKRMILELVK